MAPPQIALGGPPIIPGPPRFSRARGARGAEGGQGAKGVPPRGVREGPRRAVKEAENLMTFFFARQHFLRGKFWFLRLK